MATLGELKSRIANECNRTDLTTEIADSINRAIEYYAADRFWWSESITTVTTTANDEYVSIPSGLRYEDTNGLFIEVGAYRYPLHKIDRERLQYWQSTQNLVGQPVEYAVEDERWRLFPTPNAAYTITVLGVFDVTAPSSDSESNDWTNYAEDLIAARTRYLIARDRTYDPEMANAARIAEQEAYDRLCYETARRIADGSIDAGW